MSLELEVYSCVYRVQYLTVAAMYNHVQFSNGEYSTRCQNLARIHVARSELVIHKSANTELGVSERSELIHFQTHP